MRSLNILLSCSYGFSTSILVSQVEDYFKEKKYPFTVEALPETSALSGLDKFDVILIGPQVRYLMSKFQKIVGSLKPVCVMDSCAYGMQKVDLIIESMLKNMEADNFYER
ncbi:hypothetical protein [Spiroplasma endosymbiont of Labia minor]|uniref:PTS sugar transporter subunit IIB n=1 Tax=Spiroplasma endosymbiont of Labia minor TaxID=3066305 RepID=UPI0030CE2B5C